MYWQLARFLRTNQWTHWETALIHGRHVLVYWVFRPGERYPAVVARVATTGHSRELAEVEADALTRLRPFSDSLGVPRLLHQEDGPGVRRLLIQSGVRGCPLADQVSPDDRALLSRQVRIVDRWLEQFQCVDSGVAIGDSFEPWLSRCWEGSQTATSGEEAILIDEARVALERIGRRPATPVHGDFWAGNILVEGQRVSVIDWDRFHFGTPTEDIFNFLSAASYRNCPDAVASASLLWDAFFGNSALSEIGACITNQILLRHRLDTDLIRPLFTLFLATRLVTGGFVHDQAWQILTSCWVRSGFPRPFSPRPFSRH